MKRPAPKSIVFLCGVFLLVCVVICWILIPSNRARRAAERTRQSLRAQGFKLDLKQFALSSSHEERVRANILLSAGRASVGILPMAPIDLLRPVATNAAVLLYAQEKFPANGRTELWPKLASSLDAAAPSLDQAVSVTSGGHLRFEPSTGSGGEFIILYLADLRSLAAAFGARTIVELHRSNHVAAYNNLLALTRLATEWDIEPIEQAHYLRFFLVDTAERTLWQALHSPGWTDAELALLQQEWKKPQFFSDLPEAIACSRAALLEQQEREAKQSLGPPLSTQQILSDFFSSPLGAWNEVHSRISDSRYRHYGVYEAQNQTMLFYRDREIELRNAVGETSWTTMRRLPGMTNLAGFGQRSGLQTTVGFAPRGGGYRQGSGLVRRAAEAETARRLSLTALALGRYRLAHGSYPRSLDDLAPGFLATNPIDFMDGQPLRYELWGKNDFILYSTGLDCVDDGGIMMRTEPQGGYGPGFYGRGGRHEGPDTLWPRPASEEEVQLELTRTANNPGQTAVPRVAFP